MSSRLTSIPILLQNWVRICFHNAKVRVRGNQSCTTALDGCIYLVPLKACHIIMKSDPNHNDEISRVGDDLGCAEGCKYSGTVTLKRLLVLTDVCHGQNFR